MHTIKKILPAAILAAFAGAAQAQVSVYGLIDMSYGKSEFVGDKKADFHSGGDDGSSQGNSTTRIGFKGSTDVGNGIKANFKLESGGIDSNGSVNNNGNFFNRKMWFGFSGGFGEVRLGRQDNVPFQAMGDFDLNGQSNAASAQQNSTVAVWSLRGRQSRSLQYMTPEVGGFKAQFGFVPEGDVAGDKATYSGAVNFSAGAFAAGIAGESKRTNAPGAEDFASVAASYDFKFAKLSVGYADAGVDNKGYTLGVNVPVAGFNIGAHYGKNQKGLKDEAAEVWINREVFKNTYGYAEYGYAERLDAVGASSKNDQETFAVGVIYVF